MRREQRHHFAFAAVGSGRHATTDDFAETGEVWADAAAHLIATPRGTEAGHHFVKDEEGPVLGGEIAQALQIAIVWPHKAHIASHWLDDDRRHLLAVAFEHFLHRFEIVIGHHQGFFGKGSRYTGAIGIAKGGGASSPRPLTDDRHGRGSSRRI